MDQTVQIPDRRSYTGVDRGFIFFETESGTPWRGITQIEELEENFRIETAWIDGKKVSQRFFDGDYSAKVTSYDDPFAADILDDQLYGFSFREHYQLNGEDRYRLHIIHGVSITANGAIHTSISEESEPSGYSWNLKSIDVQLAERVVGSHLILDSEFIFEWILRDIEDILYGWKTDTLPKMPSIDEMYEIFSTMNLIIIDHGDGTWSAVGHETQIQMLDPTEFAITSPSIEMINDFTYDIESLIRNDQWLR